MNILVVNPANRPYTNLSILAEPLDVLQIATIIEQKYSQVQVIDMDGLRLENNLNSYLREENIVIFVYDYQLPLHTTEAMENIFEIIDRCKFPTHFIMIGKTSSYYCEKFLKRGVDIVVRGVADSIIIPVLDALIEKGELDSISNLAFKRENEIVYTKKEKSFSSICNLPIPNRELLDLSPYMEDVRTMITSRGCIGQCQFCTTPYFFGGWSCLPVSQVLDEISLLVTQYHTKKILFLDDNATVNKKRMMEICAGIKEKKISCLFGCLSSIPCYDQELFLKMYEVGFRWVHFGIESASERVLVSMNKAFPIETTKKVIREVKEMGYRVRTSFILDYPGSNASDIEKTRDFILELTPHEVRLHYLAYRVGTPIFSDTGGIVTSQYIHSNQSSLCTDEMNQEIQFLVEELKKKHYSIVSNEVDWNHFRDLDVDTRIAAFTPIRYGMCWYE